MIAHELAEAAANIDAEFSALPLFAQRRLRDRVADALLELLTDRSRGINLCTLTENAGRSTAPELVDALCRKEAGAFLREARLTLRRQDDDDRGYRPYAENGLLHDLLEFAGICDQVGLSERRAIREWKEAA